MSVTIWNGTDYIIDDSITDETSSVCDIDISIYAFHRLNELKIKTIGELISKGGWNVYKENSRVNARVIEHLSNCLNKFGFRFVDCPADKYPTIDMYINEFKEADKIFMEQCFRKEANYYEHNCLS